MYCLQHGAALAQEFWQIYQNTAYVHIDGNYITKVSVKENGVVTNKEFSKNDANVYSTYNGILAYLGWETSGGYGGYGNVPNYTESQKTMWPFMNEWSQKIGQSHGIYIADPQGKNALLKNEGYLKDNIDPLYTAAKDYAESRGHTTSTNTKASGTDNTKKENLKSLFFSFSTSNFLIM